MLEVSACEYMILKNSQCDQLPVGLIAQLVEHCTGIKQVVGWNPVQTWIFFQALISQNCDGHSFLYILVF